MITNLDDIKLSYVRSDYGGVVRKCGSTITLTGKARNMIVSYYTENKLKSTGAFAVYRINNNCCLNAQSIFLHSSMMDILHR